MSIDTSMYALLNSAPNPGASFSQGLQAGQQNKLARMQMDQATAQAAEAKQAGERKNRLAQLLGMPENYDAGGNLKREALPQIAAIDPAQYPTYQKQIAEQAKAAREQEKAELATKREQFNTYGQIIGSARDQASYERALGALQRMGVDVSKESPVFDPNAVSQALQMTLDGKAQLEQVWKGKQFDLDERRFGETVRNNKAQNGIAQGNLAVSQGQLGVAQGNLGVNQAREAREANAPKGQFDSERGLLIDPRTGVARPVVGADGQPLGAKDKPLTETQGKATGFAARAQQADKLIAGLDYSSAAINSKASVENTPLVGGMLGAAVNSFALSATDQKAEQAQRDFINAILRQESGAAIGKDEFNNARKQYFPQPGDDAETLAQKAANRKLAIEGLKAQAGPGASKIDGMIDSSSKPPAKRVEEAVKNGEAAKLVNARPAQVKTAADYAKLPSGTVYTAPDGSMRTKS